MKHNVFVYAAPWCHCTIIEAEFLREEALREIATDHPLGGALFEVMARTSTDELLLCLENSPFDYATLQLTWSGEPEKRDKPFCDLWISHEEWVERCMRRAS